MTVPLDVEQPGVFDLTSPIGILAPDTVDHTTIGAVISMFMTIKMALSHKDYERDVLKHIGVGISLWDRKLRWWRRAGQSKSVGRFGLR